MSRRIVTKDTAAIAASMMSGLGLILHSATKRKTKRSESGAERAAKRLAAEKKATAKRLKDAPEDRNLSRQVVRQMQRRAKKMPVAIDQVSWHQANGYPTVGIRRAA